MDRRAAGTRTTAAVDGLQRRWSDDATPVRQPVLSAVATEEPRHWTPFVVGVAASLVLLAAFTVIAVFRVAGPSIGAVGDEGGQGLAALTAAITCAMLARRSVGKIRMGWGLIGASAFIGFGVGSIALVAYTLTTGHAAPFPSPADAVFVAGQVVLIAGLLTFPSSPARAVGRSRVTVDGLVIAISLLYICWTLGLGALYRTTHLSAVAGIVGLSYPVTDMVGVTILVLMLRRAPRVKMGRLSLLTAALVVKLIADAGLAVSRGAIGWGLDSDWFDLAWTAAYLLLALATVYPTRAAVAAEEEGPTTLWQMLMPWLGLVGVMVTVTVITLTGRPIDSFLVYPGVALAVLLMVSQVLSYRDSLKFLKMSRTAEAALKARTTLLNQVITHAPLGVARINADGRLIDANPRLGTLLHAPMKILVGAHISEFSQRFGETIARSYAQLREGALDTVEDDGEVTRADGSTVWLHTTTTAVRKADGTFDYYLSMVEDISLRHEAEETAMANLAGLERLNKMKSEFVSMVSHEFRTALVGIQGFSELIRDDTLDIADIKGLAGDINSDAMRLNRMITEMLDLDRMEAGKIRLSVKPVDMNTLIRDAVERAQITTDNHHVVADLDAAIPLSAGDADRLVQVVTNLLSNAVKYSPQGGEIKVSSRFEEGAIHVSVQDHGLGIPREFIDRVFGRYERFESNRAGKVAGTGLGLAISHQIVELHGGRMWVESEVGKGSTFHFTIPVATAVAQDAAANNAAA